MATALQFDQAPANAAGKDTLRLVDILEADNIADLLDDVTLRAIGDAVIRDFDIDWQSCTEWRNSYKRWMALAMLVRQEKTTPWQGASNVKFPLLTTACIVFNSRTYPAIISGSNLVKGKVLGPDPDGSKRERADRIGAHMSWQLLYRNEDWEPDTDQMLLQLPVVGCVMRKTYYDEVTKQNCSETIPADDFVIEYTTPSLERAPRYTHILRFYPHEVRERIAAELWRSIPLSDNLDHPDDESAPAEFYEQHRLWDLDGDGYPEPYVVTTNKEGDVARIAAAFDHDSITLKKTKHGGTESDVVVRIERDSYFTRYIFMPSIDGSFYGLGFGFLLDNIVGPVDATINQMLDAATLANAQGGFIGSGVNIKGGDFTFRRVGEWKRVDTAGGSLRENIVPLSLPGPSGAMFNLLEFLVDAGKQVTSTADILTGGNEPANTPLGTTLAKIREAEKVMTVITKRVLRGLAHELKILFKLNGRYVDQEYFALNDLGPDEAQRVERADYQDKDLDVVPVADPNMASDMAKLGSANYLGQFIGNPLVNQGELIKRMLEAGSIADVKALIAPAPPPDPKILIEGAKLANDRDETKATVRNKDAQAASFLAAAAASVQPLGLASDAAIFAGAAVKLAQDAADYSNGDPNAQPTDGPGSMGGMAPQSADGGPVPILPGPAGGPDGGMGPGGVVDPGGAGAGGPVGPAG